MGQTDQKLEKGTYAYSSHSIIVSGDVVELFTGRWETQQDGDTRVLVKYPQNTELEGSLSMCVLRLRSPLTIDEYREVKHPEARALMKNLEGLVEMVVLPSSMVCTIPDFLPETIDG